MKLSCTCLALLFTLFLAAAAHAEPPLPGALQGIPRYPGAVVVQTVDMGGNTNAMFEVAAKPGDIVDFFNDKLPAQGWNKTMEARQEDGAMVAFSKGSDSLTVGVGAADEGKVSYTLILAKQ